MSIAKYTITGKRPNYANPNWLAEEDYILQTRSEVGAALAGVLELNMPGRWDSTVTIKPYDSLPFDDTTLNTAMDTVTLYQGYGPGGDSSVKPAIAVNGTGDDTHSISITENELIYCGQAENSKAPLTPNALEMSVVTNTLAYETDEIESEILTPGDDIEVSQIEEYTVPKDFGPFVLVGAVGSETPTVIPDNPTDAEFQTGYDADNGTSASVIRTDGGTTWIFTVTRADFANQALATPAIQDLEVDLELLQDGSVLDVECPIAGGPTPDSPSNEGPTYYIARNNELEPFEIDLGSSVGPTLFSVVALSKQVYPMDSTVVVNPGIAILFSNPAFSVPAGIGYGLYGRTDTLFGGSYPSPAFPVLIEFDGTVGEQTCTVTINYTMSDVTSETKTGTFIFTIKATGVAATASRRLYFFGAGASV